MSLKGMGWGYYEIDPKFSGKDFRVPNLEKVKPTPRNEVVLDKHYVLIGVEPPSMFEPGREPQGFNFWHWDNSMQPWLRHISPANKTGHKLWSRLTYKGFRINNDVPIDENHRTRVNRRLFNESNGYIKDIAELWGLCRDTKLPEQKHALICASSQRNHRWFGETQAQWLHRVTQGLRHMGYSYSIRQKVEVELRKKNETTDEIRRLGCDLVVTNYSACSSEAAVLGVPVVTTTDWNCARTVSTPWEDFLQGKIHQYSRQQLDEWTTRICAYTWHREELNSLSWIDTHPEATDLRRLRYGQL